MDEVQNFFESVCASEDFEYEHGENQPKKYDLHLPRCQKHLKGLVYYHL